MCDDNMNTDSSNNKSDSENNYMANRKEGALDGQGHDNDNKNLELDHDLKEFYLESERQQKMMTGPAISKQQNP